MPKSLLVRWAICLLFLLALALALSLPSYGARPSLAQERPTPTNEGLVTDTPRPTPTEIAPTTTATPEPPTATATPEPPTATATATATPVTPTQEPTQEPTQQTAPPAVAPEVTAAATTATPTLQPTRTPRMQALHLPKTGYFTTLAPTGLLLLVLIGALFGARSLRQRRRDDDLPDQR